MRKFILCTSLLLASGAQAQPELFCTMNETQVTCGNHNSTCDGTIKKFRENPGRHSKDRTLFGNLKSGDKDIVLVASYEPAIKKISISTYPLQASIFTNIFESQATRLGGIVSFVIPSQPLDDFITVKYMCAFGQVPEGF